MSRPPSASLFPFPLHVSVWYSRLAASSLPFPFLELSTCSESQSAAGLPALPRASSGEPFCRGQRRAHALLPAYAAKAPISSVLNSAWNIGPLTYTRTKQAFPLSILISIHAPSGPPAESNLSGHRRSRLTRKGIVKFSIARIQWLYSLNDAESYLIVQVTRSCDLMRFDA
ncbi:hypothetical protein B0H15DRAFT_150944 [Mycena belliarum]|uniref:Uncharacterized protein n=1 Tax=Mycena belliarum TaxID=1033014 RepID=A0AAD6UE38_9AGAR|nr:hypothetical protein B0H15DRAFT_150944 [Mycena belliae]